MVTKLSKKPSKNKPLSKQPWTPCNSNRWWWTSSLNSSSNSNNNYSSLPQLKPLLACSRNSNNPSLCNNRCLLKWCSQWCNSRPIRWWCRWWCKWCRWWWIRNSNRLHLKSLSSLKNQLSLSLQRPLFSKRLRCLMWQDSETLISTISKKTCKGTEVSSRSRTLIALLKWLNLRS